MNHRIALLLAGLILALPLMGQTTLNGAGASFPNPIYSKWFSEYNKLHSDVQVNYQSLGSGAGIRQVISGTVDFGASDGPMTDEQLKEAKAKILHVPTVLGAVVPAYNVPGVSGEVKFTPEALAGIFHGENREMERPGYRAGESRESSFPTVRSLLCTARMEAALLIFSRIISPRSAKSGSRA